jgi:hypothetical protein
MIERGVELGPGSLRVGRFIGRLGVVTMPAIERGLGLVDRVVRRHVAKLEKVGWCERTPAIRGDGMLVWLTPSGLDGVGLGELPAVRAPGPFSPQTVRSIRVAWAAADTERAGHRWIASRERALAPGRWGAEVANERGGRSRRLPDLVFWPSAEGSGPVAVVLVAGGAPNPRRQRAALEGWQAAIATGRYAQVQYLAGPAAGRSLECLAAQIGLTADQFIAVEHVETIEPPETVEVIGNHAAESTVPLIVPVAVPDPPQPLPSAVVPQRSTSGEPVETPDQEAQRWKMINEMLGYGEPAPRRRWLRRAT